MKRPTVTPDMIAAAAQRVAVDLKADADTIARSYSHPMDGFELAKALERDAGWQLTMADLEELDAMEVIVGRLLREAEQRWFDENDIQPPLPIGAATTRGVIEGICEHSPGRYLVKETGCTENNRWLLVKFEDAVAA